MEIKRVKRNDRDFPLSVKEFSPDVKELYYAGNLDLVNSRCIAVVGSRDCSEYGKRVSGNIGQRIGESGGAVVSGLAKGIDAAAHRGALKVDGKTIAVLGCGIDRYYPSDNRELQNTIGKRGLLLSEYPPGTIARSYYFPQRNRIISALSESVVIVEAKNRSGALITAECAAEQGKNLYAVPGNIDSQYSFGTNKLIRENVTPLIFLDDVLIDIGMSPLTDESVIMQLGEAEKTVYQIISNCGEITIDDIHHRTNMKPEEISGIITILEMKGMIFSSLGKVFVAKF